MTAIDIVQWLGETSLAVSLLILLVLAIRKPFTNAFGARAAYALWLAPAVRLFMPELKVLAAPNTLIEPMALSVPVAPTPAMFDAALSPTLTAGTVAAPFDFASLAAATALVIWATVAFAWFNVKLESQARFMNAKMAGSKPMPESVAVRARALSKQFGLKRTPRIRISDDETGPCVVGLFRPVVFLPAAFETEYSERERHLALAHEIAHIARGDMAMTLAAIALQSAQWPNPLAHFAFNKFRTDQEAACDAYVLARCANGQNTAGEYAGAIMKSVRAGSSAPAFGLSLAHPVKERLMLLKNQKNSPARLLVGAVSVIAFTAASLGATASYGFTDANTDVRVAKHKKRSATTIHVDDDETMEIDGVKNPAKIEYEDEDGVRTVRIYNKKGKLISEDTYQPGEELPFDEVRVRTKDGDVRKFKIDRPHGEKRVSIVKLHGDGDADVDWNVEILADDIEHDYVFAGDSEGDFVKSFAFVTGEGPHIMQLGGMTSDCLRSEDEDGRMVLEWRSDDGDEAVEASPHEIICIGGDDAADPAARAEALRNAIDHMEENAKREAERREKLLVKLRAELKELESKN